MNDTHINQELNNLRQRLESLEAAALPNDPQEPASCECKGAAMQTAPKAHINADGEMGTVESAYAAALAGVARGRGRATVDASRNDNGFLGCVYGVYRSSTLRVFSHWSTAQAFANLRLPPPDDFSIIVGHGAPGIIICGTGQIVDGVDKYIAASNRNAWWPHASRGVTGAQLTLFGCKVGSGLAGTNLLRLVASAVKKPVGAWTGDVWCGGGRVWGTGQYKLVRPGTRTEAIEEMDMYSESEREPMKVLRVASAEGFEEIPVAQVKSVNFTPIGSWSVEGLPAKKAVHAEKRDATDLLKAIDFEHPFVTEDVPGAILMGMLTVTSETKGNEHHVRSFRVLGSSLLQDVIFPNTYYHVSEDLQRMLSQ